MSNDLLTAHLLDVDGKSAGEVHLPQVVRSRGHKFLEDRTLHLVVSNEVENLSKSSDAKRFLTSIGVWDDILRVRKSKRIKSGVRVHAVGPLVVVGDDKNARKALRNFE